MCSGLCVYLCEHAYYFLFLSEDFQAIIISKINGSWREQQKKEQQQPERRRGRQQIAFAKSKSSMRLWYTVDIFFFSLNLEATLWTGFSLSDFFLNLTYGHVMLFILVLFSVLFFREHQFLLFRYDYCLFCYLIMNAITILCSIFYFRRFFSSFIFPPNTFCFFLSLLF